MICSICQLKITNKNESEYKHLCKKCFEEFEKLNDRKLDMKLEQIAKEFLDIETLTTRHSDSLDFHDISVWSIKEALKMAYHLGVESSKKS